MVNGENLLFRTHLSGNEFGCFDGNTGVFTAPIGGRYAFGLYVLLYQGDSEYFYYIQMRRSGSDVHYLGASGKRTSSYNYKYFQVETELTKGQTVYFKIGSRSSGLKYDEISFVEGKLVKR